MRQLATLKRIDALLPIEKADAIECAVVGGWKTVVKKGEFAVGEVAVFCEIDSWIPEKLAPFLVKGKEAREYMGVRGERLKTIRLRGQISQGLLLSRDVALPMTNSFKEGDDVSEFLGINKWEKPISAQMAGIQKGNFPTVIPKTDQERIQNIAKELEAARAAGHEYEETEKLEGSSMTLYLIADEFGVCSRNIDLKESEGNAFWRRARLDDIENKMRAIADSDFAIQGELIGPGIEGNIYGLLDTEFYVYDIYDIPAGDYVEPDRRRAMVEAMGLKNVPVINEAVTLLPMEQMLARVETHTVLPTANTKTLAEGRVYKQRKGGMTFKVISNLYLLGEK